MKLSDLTPEELYGRLDVRRMLQRRKAIAWWQYMDLEQPLQYVARILLEQGDRFPPLLFGWSDLAIGSVDERLILEAFLLGGKDSPNEDLLSTWQANDLDEYSSELHRSAMVSGEHYIMVGPGDGAWPMVTVEYPDQVAVELDPRTRQPIAGIKVWKTDDSVFSDTMGVLYVPGLAYTFENGKVVDRQELGEWAQTLASDPTLPSIPIIPALNQPRRGVGFSDLVQLKPLVDGANQFATNMMAAGEHHAVARKWAVGVTAADFVDGEGKPVPLWKAAMGDVWAIPHAKGERNAQTQEVKVGQFTASDLANFHNSIKVLAAQFAATYGLPPSYVGHNSDSNPASAEAILYSLERLVRRTEKRQLWFGGAWERAMRVVWAILGNDPTEIARLESKWRNASTPTLASMMDAAIKGVTSGVIDNEQAWVDLRYSEETKRGLRERMARTGFQTAASLKNIDLGVGVNDAPVLGV